MKNVRRVQLTWILVTLLCVFVADQATKAVVRGRIPVGGPQFEGRSQTFFYFTHERNTGLVGGAFHNRPLVAYAASVVATGLLVYLATHLDPASRLQSLAYGLVAGGAAGNLTDRLRLGAVTDFLQFHFYFVPFDFPWKNYPAFNIADAAICVGVPILIFTWTRAEREHAARNP